MDVLTRRLDHELSRYVRDRRMCVAVTGSGGKTTSIERLGRRWARQGLSVLVCTTTHLAHPSVHHYDVDQIYLCEDGVEPQLAAASHTVVLAGVEAGEKLASLPERVFANLAERFDRILVESDGARGLPLKIHTERDPVVLPTTDVVLAVAGLAAYGKPLDERICLFPERMRMATSWEGSVVDASLYRRLLEHPDGLLKGCADIPTMVLLNQGDLLDGDRRDVVAHAMCACDVHAPYTLVVGSWHHDRTYFFGEIGGRKC